MARKLRIQFPGAIYHVINRGNYRRDLFSDAGAAKAFLRTLEEAACMYGWRLHAYVLMHNHFHLALGTPEPNLVQGMHWLQSTLATRFNRFRSENGHLFQGRYKALLVEDAHALGRVVDYIHLNPVRAGIVPASAVQTYRWSSLYAMCRGKGLPVESAVWLKAIGGWQDDVEGPAAYKEYLVRLAREPDQWEELGRVNLSKGWAIGTEGWKQALATEHGWRALDSGYPGEEVKELRERAWESALENRLAQLGLVPPDLVTRPRKMDWKLALARELRMKCGASLIWLAKRLHLGSAASLRSYLCRERKASINKQRPDPIT